MPLTPANLEDKDNKKYIVLAHGFLGFGSNPWLPGVNYFNGVADVLRDLGHMVLESSVNPLGSLEERSGQLAAQIDAEWPVVPKISIIAHSMGGLDARRVIAKHESVGRRVKNLITIATPHFGTPVANAFLDKLPVEVFGSIPAQFVQYFSVEKNMGALRDLRVRNNLHDLDRLGVEYMEVVCVPPKSRIESVLAWLHLDGLLPKPRSASVLFELTRALGKVSGPNDGLVTRKSACCPPREPIEEWPVDHGGAIGWPSDLFGTSTLGAAVMPPADHLARYVSLAGRL